jgi:plasmid stabilization system protein ParE
MKVEISPTARRQIAELVEWWNRNRPAARVRVEEAIGTALEAIAEHPELGPRYLPRPQYRTWRLKGTPYYRSTAPGA